MPFDGVPEYPTLEERDLAVLRRVVDGLREEDSWVIGVYHMGTRHCAIGWLQNFATQHDIQRIAGLYLVPALPLPWSLFRPRPPEPTDVIIKFNDRATHKRVLALFERAIRRAERRIRRAERRSK